MCPSIDIRQSEFHSAIQSSRPQQRGIQCVRSVNPPFVDKGAKERVKLTDSWP